MVENEKKKNILFFKSSNCGSDMNMHVAGGADIFDIHFIVFRIVFHSKHKDGKPFGSQMNFELLYLWCQRLMISEIEIKKQTHFTHKNFNGNTIETTTISPFTDSSERDGAFFSSFTL